MKSLNKDVNQIIFDCLPVSGKYNFYLYCKENNLTGELVYIERFFESLYHISKTEWINIIIENENLLPYEFISIYRDVIDWHILSIYQHFTQDFMREFSSYIEWNNASMHQKISVETLREHTHHINWDLISSREDITEDILNTFSEEINWQFVTLLDFSDNFLKKHKKNIQWQNVTFSNLERYEDYKDNVDWVRLSYHETLDEDFMRTYQDLLDWNFLSSHQIMSDNFAEEFSDRINAETRTFFNDRRNRRNASPSFEVRGILPYPPPLNRQSRLRNYRPTFFEY